MGTPTEGQLERMVDRALKQFDKYEKAYKVDNNDNLIGKCRELYADYLWLKEEILSYTKSRPWLKHLEQKLP